MPLGHDGHLGQVRDHDDLVAPCEVCQHARQGHGRGAADAGIHLVKDQRVAAVGLAQDHLAGKHDAADLAAGGNAAQRPRREPGAGAVEKLHVAGPAAAPLGAREPLLGDHELGRAHLEAPHLLAHPPGKLGGRLGSGLVQRVRAPGEKGLGPLHLPAGTTLGLAAVAGGLHDLPGLPAPREDVLHARPEGTQQPLQLRHPGVHGLEGLRVKLHLVGIGAQLGRHVLHVDEGALQRLRKAAQARVVARGVLQGAHGAADGVAGPLVARQQRVGARGGLHEGLAVLGARQGVLKLLELPLLGVDLVDAPQRKGGLLELLAGCAAKLADALELGGGILGGGKRLLVGCERGRHGLSRPGVEHLDVGLDGKEALVLVLAAEVYGGPHAGGELTHAGHVPVYLHATAAVRGDAAAHHAAVGVSPAHEEAALDAEPVRTLPDGRRVRALPH